MSNALLYCVVLNCLSVLASILSLWMWWISFEKAGIFPSMHFPLMWLTETQHTIKSIHEMAVSCLYKAVRTVFQFALSFFFLKHGLNPKWMEASSIMDGSVCQLSCAALITAFSSCYWKRVLINECRCSLFQRSTWVDNESLPVWTYLVKVIDETCVSSAA